MPLTKFLERLLPGVVSFGRPQVCEESSEGSPGWQAPGQVNHLNGATAGCVGDDRSDRWPSSPL